MPTAACIIADALSRAEPYALTCIAAIRGMLATRRLYNALAPRIGAACRLTEKMFKIVAAAPTAWCAAHLRLDSPTAAVLQRTPAAFVQLRSISVEGQAVGATMRALTAMPALLNQRTLREIDFGCGIEVTDAMLLGFAIVTARLETLVIDGAAVTDLGLACLRDTPMIATLRPFSLFGGHRITDAGVADLLGAASELRSLSLRACRLLSGAFLTQLHEHCHVTLSDLDLSGCESIDNAGAAVIAATRAFPTVARRQVRLSRSLR